MRTILIVNQSTVVDEEALAAAVAAIQAQVSGEFAAAYGAEVLLDIGADNHAVERVYVLDDTTQADALGYHQLSNDVPVGYCFAKTCLEVGDHWQSCLDHEILEQIMDPCCALGTLSAVGGRTAFLDYEVCDAVENDEYTGLGGVPLSNFVLPAWFEPAVVGERYDYLGKLTAPATLDSGGYFGYSLNLKTWRQVTGDRCPQRQVAPGKFERRTLRRVRRIAAGASKWVA